MSVRRRTGLRVSRLVSIPLVLAWGCAHASFLSGDALDTAADVMAWVVLALVPVIGIVVFWIVHVMPEKIAHRRHHPQTKAIQTLCLLSLVFGGLLWPIAWLWAYTRPVAYKVAYGTDLGEEYFNVKAEKLHAGELTREEAAELVTELDTMQARAGLSAPMTRLREEAAALAKAPHEPAVAPPPGAAAAAEPERRRA